MMTKEKNMPVGYEEWDEGEDKKYILIYQVNGLSFKDVYQS